MLALLLAQVIAHNSMNMEIPPSPTPTFAAKVMVRKGPNGKPQSFRYGNVNIDMDYVSGNVYVEDCRVKQTIRYMDKKGNIMEADIACMNGQIIRIVSPK
jgi:hypothetical protein